VLSSFLSNWGLVEKGDEKAGGVARVKHGVKHRSSESSGQG